MIRYYISPRTGTGTFEDPYRAELDDIPNAGGIVGYDCPQKGVFLRRVQGDQKCHDEIFEKRLGVYITPLYEDEKEESSGLDTSYADLTEKFRSVLEAECARWAYPITKDLTLRKLIGDIVRNNVLGQKYMRNEAVSAVLQCSTDAKCSALSAATKTDLAALAVLDLRQAADVTKVTEKLQSDLVPEKIVIARQEF